MSKIDMIVESPEEQELRVLIAIDQFGPRDRNWFATEYQDAFDRCVRDGLIARPSYFEVTDSGDARLKKGAAIVRAKDDQGATDES